MLESAFDQVGELGFVRELGKEFERIATGTEAGRGGVRKAGSSRAARPIVTDAVALCGSVLVAVAVIVIALSARSSSPSPVTSVGSGIRVPVGSAVPAGFDPVALSALTDRQWWLLGETPESPDRDVVIVRTTDAGRHWVDIPAPRVPYKQAGCPYARVSQLTFANPRDGFAYGCALYVTHDGGGHWQRARLSGYVTQLVTADGYAYAIVSPADNAGTRLMRSPAGLNDWRTLPAAGEPDTGLQARGSDVLVQSDAGTLRISDLRTSAYRSHRPRTRSGAHPPRPPFAQLGIVRQARRPVVEADRLAAAPGRSRGGSRSRL